MTALSKPPITQTSHPTLTPNELRIANASKSAKIKSIDWAKPEQVAEFSVLMAEVSVSYGISIPTTSEEKGHLISKLSEYYGHLTINEIRTALDLHSTGQLDERIAPYYGAFTFDWLAQVLYLYAKKRKSVLTRLRAQTKTLPEVNISAEQNYIDLVIFYEQNFEAPLMFPFQKVFDYLEQKGIISMTTAEKQKYFKTILERITDNKTEGLFSSNAESREIEAKIECRKMLVLQAVEAEISHKQKDL